MNRFFNALGRYEFSQTELSRISSILKFYRTGLYTLSRYFRVETRNLRWAHIYLLAELYQWQETLNLFDTTTWACLLMQMDRIDANAVMDDESMARAATPFMADASQFTIGDLDTVYHRLEQQYGIRVVQTDNMTSNGEIVDVEITFK